MEISPAHDVSFPDSLYLTCSLGLKSTQRLIVLPLAGCGVYTPFRRVFHKTELGSSHPLCFPSGQSFGERGCK